MGALQSLRVVNSEIYKNTLEFFLFDCWFLFNNQNLLNEAGEKYIAECKKLDSFYMFTSSFGKESFFEVLKDAKKNGIKNVQQLREREKLQGKRAQKGIIIP